MPATIVSLSHDTVSACLSVCVNALAEGGVIVFPTESSYALGADATNAAAVDKVYEMKARPASKGMPVLVDSIETMARYADVEGLPRFLAEKLMPGQLNLVVRQTPGALAPNVGERDTIAFRIPNHEFDLRLAKAYGKPITATSANLSGHPAIYSSVEAVTRFVRDASVIVDVGDLPLRSFSTIFDLTRQPYAITRQGMLSAKKLYATVRQYYESQPSSAMPEWASQAELARADATPKSATPSKPTTSLTPANAPKTAQPVKPKVVQKRK
ncbi:Threonylcarbamoyl-AMP synthase [uncultured archaeon]|nr:Threonylcarbamoyl-AMP synthase [uncultured archaeon]